MLGLPLFGTCGLIDQPDGFEPIAVHGATHDATVACGERACEQIQSGRPERDQCGIRSPTLSLRTSELASVCSYIPIAGIGRVASFQADRR
jgi:hypothetical protein